MESDIGERNLVLQTELTISNYFEKFNLSYFDRGPSLVCCGGGVLVACRAGGDRVCTTEWSESAPPHLKNVLPYHTTTNTRYYYSSCPLVVVVRPRTHDIFIAAALTNATIVFFLKFSTVQY